MNLLLNFFKKINGFKKEGKTNKARNDEDSG